MKNRTQGNGLLIFIIIVGLVVVAYFIFKNKTVHAPEPLETEVSETENTKTEATSQNKTLETAPPQTSLETEIETIESEVNDFETEIEDLRFEDLGFE